MFMNLSRFIFPLNPSPPHLPPRSYFLQIPLNLETTPPRVPIPTRHAGRAEGI